MSEMPLDVLARLKPIYWQRDRVGRCQRNAAGRARTLETDAGLDLSRLLVSSEMPLDVLARLKQHDDECRGRGSYSEMPLDVLARLKLYILVASSDVCPNSEMPLDVLARLKPLVDGLNDDRHRKRNAAGRARTLETMKLRRYRWYRGGAKCRWTCSHA